MTIELSSGKHEVFKFPGGELGVRMQEPFYVGARGADYRIDVTAYLENSDDIMELLLLNDAFGRHYTKINRLIIPYVPYARQDRVCNRGESLSIKVMCDLINSVEAEKVIIWDPHSDVTPALINNCIVKELHELVPKDITGGKLVVCPDAGAEKKIMKTGHNYIMARKHRDPVTGEITHTSIHGHSAIGDCIILDDICDGGRTFIELAKVLREKGARTVDLYVTHGIFSKGFDVFKGHINNIYYYNKGELQCKSIH